MIVTMLLSWLTLGFTPIDSCPPGTRALRVPRAIHRGSPAETLLTCLPCPLGRFNEKAGPTARCRRCARGTTTRSAGQQKCIVALQSVAPQRVLTSMPTPAPTDERADTYQDRADAQRDADPDWLLAPGGVAAGACPAGRFADFGGSGGAFTERCTRCQPGWYQPDAHDITLRARCLPCSKGRWAPALGANACAPLVKFPSEGGRGAGGAKEFPVTGGFCSPGRWGDKGQLSQGNGCKLCPPGRFGAGGSATSACSGACAAGRYGIGGSTGRQCTGRCAPGRVCGEGSTTALGDGDACPRGRYAILGADTEGCELRAPAELRPGRPADDGVGSSDGGYATASGEIGACVLDKAYRVLELLQAVLACSFTSSGGGDNDGEGRAGAAGRGKAATVRTAAAAAVAQAPSRDACDPSQAAVLRTELLGCCDGVEHLVLEDARQRCRERLRASAARLAPDAAPAAQPHLRSRATRALPLEQSAIDMAAFERMLGAEWRLAQLRAHEGAAVLGAAALGRDAAPLAVTGAAAAAEPPLKLTISLPAVWEQRERQWRYERAVAAKELLPVFRGLLAEARHFYRAGWAIVQARGGGNSDLTPTSRHLLRACDQEAEPHADCSSGEALLLFVQRFDCRELGNCGAAQLAARYGDGWQSTAPSPAPSPLPTPAPPPPMPWCPAGRFRAGAAATTTAPAADDDDDAHHGIDLANSALYTTAGAASGSSSGGSNGSGGKCLICPAAKYSTGMAGSGDGTGADRYSCALCAPGRFASRPGRVVPCDACAPGLFAGGGFAFCVPCDPGTEAPRAGSQRCTVCGAGRFSSAAASVRCARCPKGKYRLAPRDFRQAQSCDACPPEGSVAWAMSACANGYSGKGKRIDAFEETWREIAQGEDDAHHYFSLGTETVR